MHQFPLTSFIKRAGCLFLLTTLAAMPVGAVNRPPNILVILADDLGRGDHSGFGTEDIRTPHIDRLAREGITFENFYANSSVCSPTRAALLTGRYPDRVGVPGVIREETPENSWGYMAPQAVLLPQVLKTAGYRSAIIGKWHLGTSAPNTPLDHGFAHFHGFLGDMMDDYWTHLRKGRNYMRRDRDVITPEGHATDLFTNWACDYLSEQAGAGGPFFLYLAYNAPHNPIQPPADWLEKVKRREPAMKENRAKLVALIEHMDDGIGRVLATLDRYGLAENTLVIFTSDNGGVLTLGANNGPWRGTKGEMYEGSLRVIGLARWPGHIAPGSRTGRLTLTMDIYATACEAASAIPPAGLDAISFLGAMLRRPEAEELAREVYFVRREGGLAFLGKTTEACIRGEWKVVINPFSRPELYNLRQDPGEKQDLAKAEPQILRTLAAALQHQVQEGGQVPWQASPAPPQVVEQSQPTNERKNQTTL